MRRRFFVEQFDGSRAVMEGEAAHHLGRVLRAERGQLYELSNGHRVCLAQISDVKDDRIEFSLLEDLQTPQPTLHTTLLLSVVKFDAFEWAIEKATELGVSTIVPLAAARSERALLSAAAKRKERWTKMLVEASQQSRRLRVPALRPLLRSEQAFQAEQSKLRIMLSEQADAPPLRQALAGESPSTVALAIGPEGGWTDIELNAAKSAGFRHTSLGPLILRTETAVVAALASINYAFAE